MFMGFVQKMSVFAFRAERLMLVNKFFKRMIGIVCQKIKRVIGTGLVCVVLR